MYTFSLYNWRCSSKICCQLYLLNRVDSLTERNRTKQPVRKYIWPAILCIICVPFVVGCCSPSPPTFHFSYSPARSRSRRKRILYRLANVEVRLFSLDMGHWLAEELEVEIFRFYSLIVNILTPHHTQNLHILHINSYIIRLKRIFNNVQLAKQDSFGNTFGLFFSLQ